MTLFFEINCVLVSCKYILSFFGFQNTVYF